MKTIQRMTTGFLVLALGLSACHGEGPPPAPPAAEVDVVTLKPRRIEDSSEYLATLSSRRSVTVFPQVSAYVKSIQVKSGARVKAGTILMVLDAEQDQATLRNQLASRESGAAAQAFARDRLNRQQNLRKDGVVSQQDLDGARRDFDSAEANLRASDAQIASQRARLAYFTLIAPFDGIVGDVPVKVGDFVGPQSALTSLDQDTGLEAYVSVPADRITSLTPETLIRLLDEDGKTVAESKVSFVSPRADPSTQLILIKALYSDIPLRAAQVVRARVIWSTHDGLAIPSNALTRQAGQHFAFIIVAGPDGETARRVPVTLGDMDGNDFVVKQGLTPGQTVVVSGLHLLSEGAHVKGNPVAAVAKE